MSGQSVSLRAWFAPLQAAYRWSCKALAFGQHSAIVTWGVRATTLPHAGRTAAAVTSVVSIPDNGGWTREQQTSQEQRSMPGHALHSRCPHKRTCCYCLRLEVSFTNLIR